MIAHDSTTIADNVIRLIEAANKPTIQVVAGELAELATRGERALIEAHFPIYRRDAALVRPVVQEVEAAHGRKTTVAQLATVDAASLRDYLCRAANWQRFDQRAKKWVATDAPSSVGPIVLSRFGEWTFPPVAGVLTTPTLRPDGTILSQSGYDAATRLILADPPPMPAIPDRPTRDDALAALALLESLIEEFPFIDAPSQAVALSGMITPIVRGAFPVAPMHAIRAPTAGSGKSYFGDVVAAICTGQPMPVVAAGRTEEETEKRLGAILLAGQPLVSLDNVNGVLEGDFLCQCVERPVVQVRVLGFSQVVRIEARSTTFFATGNNLTLAGDMPRRAIVATLDPVLERPELREFTGNPVADVLADRGRFIAAALIVCRAYITAGRPDPAPRLASFEGWSDTVRSALIWLGKADAVETMEAARAEDPQLAALRAVLSAWSDAFGTGWETRRTLPDVLKAIGEQRYIGSGEAYDRGETDYRYPELRDAVLAVATVRGKPDARAFGYWARGIKGRVVDGRRLAGKTDPHGHAVKWWIETV